MPDFTHEQELINAGAKFIAGVDEVGRGPLAGPVVACAVILDINTFNVPVMDSKKLSAKNRLILYKQILDNALAIGLCSLNAQLIDEKNILQASLEAMKRAILALSIKADYAIIDGKHIPKGLSCNCVPLIKGDQKSLSVAAASIVAKVVRDNMMNQLGEYYSDYAFENHYGYGTAKHRKALELHGAIDGIHRFSFAPLRTTVTN